MGDPGNWGSKMSGNEEAVSPEIGMILMIIITVVLAAVIGAFVFGMSGNLTGSQPQFNKTITVQEITSISDTSDQSSKWYLRDQGVIDTDGNGYFIKRSLIRGSGFPEINGTYNISYSIDPGTKQRVIVEVTSVDNSKSINAYRCVIVDQVCK